MSTGNDIQDQSPSANTSSLPSIRELFGIRASDNLNSLVSTPHRSHRRGDAPPPSSYHHQALRSSSPHDGRFDSRNATRSYSFSSGEAAHPYHGNQSSTTGRRAPSPMPRSGSYSTSLQAHPPHPQVMTIAAAGGVFGPEPSASPTGFGRSNNNERTGPGGSLPPISTALPGFLPTNRGRAVSDTEAFTRSALTSSPTTSATAPAGLGQSQQGVTPYTHAPPPLQPHPNHHPSLYQDQREYFGSSAATPTTTGTTTVVNSAVARSRMGASDPLHPSLSTTITVATTPTTTTNSRQADNFTGQGSPLPDEAASAGGSHTPAWQRRSSIGTSRSSMDYPPSSSSSSVPVQEYEPHPYSSASISARRSQGPYSSEGSTHASPTRSAPISGGFGSDRAPPSAYPAQHPTYRSTSRPRSANSSEGDEPARSGYGRYECEYCSKRFNRPSSLRIHINTHTGAKPFQCPFPNCGRRFSVMSNMRRHARTHGTMMSSHSAEEDHTVSSYPTPGPGGTASNSIHHHHHHHHHHQGGADRGPMPSTSAPASSGPSSSSWSPPHHPHHAIERSSSTRSVGALDQNQGYGSSRGGGVMERSSTVAAAAGGGGGSITGNGRHNHHHHNMWRGSGPNAGGGGDRDPSGEVDELVDDDDDEEMETDVGGGSSESDGYPPSSSRSPKGSASGHVSIHRPSMAFDGQDYVMRQPFGAG